MTLKGLASLSGLRRLRQNKQKNFLEFAGTVRYAKRWKSRPHGKPADGFLGSLLCQTNIFIKQFFPHFTETLKIIVKVGINDNNLRHDFFR